MLLSKWEQATLPPKWKVLEMELKASNGRPEREVVANPLVPEKSVVQLVVRLLRRVLVAPRDLVLEEAEMLESQENLDPNLPDSKESLKDSKPH